MPFSKSSLELQFKVSAGSGVAWTWIFGAVLPLAIFGFVYYTVYGSSPLGNTMGLDSDGNSTGPGSGGSVGQSFGEHMQ